MYVGIDLGGTKVAAAVVDVSSGRVVARQAIPTDSQAGPNTVLERMAALVLATCDAAGVPMSEIDGVGLGVPGPFNQETGQTLFLPNLAGMWRDVPVRDILRRTIPCSISLINDARAFVLAEAIYGAGSGQCSVVGLTVGTGIGGGIAIDGQLYLGLDGTAGEVGHMTIDRYGPPCGCGNRGCLETFASGPAIATLGVQAILHARTTILHTLVENDVSRISPEIIMSAAEAGDAVACDILHRAGEAMGIGVANLVTILSPNCIVIGGSVAQLGDWLFTPVRAMVRQRCTVIPIDRVHIVPAALGGAAGVMGAAVWAAQRTGGHITRTG
jgi:glucokinase